MVNGKYVVFVLTSNLYIMDIVFTNITYMYILVLGIRELLVNKLKESCYKSASDTFITQGQCDHTRNSVAMDHKYM